MITRERCEYLERRAAECAAAGNHTNAATYRAQLFKCRLDLESQQSAPSGVLSLSGWRSWLGGKEPGESDALAFLDYCHESGLITEEQLARAVRFERYDPGWLTRELQRLENLGVNANAPQA